MRNCPVCDNPERDFVFEMGYKVPDNWPLPGEIQWYKCATCGMLYGDGEFDQEMLNDFYTHYYGFGINSMEVSDRLTGIADYIASHYSKEVRVVDFGGGGDDGKSIIINHLNQLGFDNTYNVNAGESVPPCDVIVASHVLEHVYDMKDTMFQIDRALSGRGELIIDIPDATGLLLHWSMPMLDFHTKHINHFRMIDCLELMKNWGYELVDSLRYVDIRSNQTAQCLRMYFKNLDVAEQSKEHIQKNINVMLYKLQQIDFPVNVWGLGDIAWHLLSQVDLDVIDYIDIDPAMRGATFDGHSIKETVTNDAPIVIVSQGQRSNLLNHIQLLGLPNKVIEI